MFEFKLPENRGEKFRITFK